MNDKIINHNNTSHSVDKHQTAEYRNKTDRNQTKFKHLCETGNEMWWDDAEEWDSHTTSVIYKSPRAKPIQQPKQVYNITSIQKTTFTEIKVT
jgi:hypothetical protein